MGQAQIRIWDIGETEAQKTIEHCGQEGDERSQETLGSKGLVNSAFLRCPEQRVSAWSPSVEATLSPPTDLRLGRRVKDLILEVALLKIGAGQTDAFENR